MKPKGFSYAVQSLISAFGCTEDEASEAASFWKKTSSPIFAQIQLDHAAVNLRKLKGATQ